MKSFRKWFGAALVLGAVGLSAQVSATVVNAGASGNGDCTFGCVWRYQQVYSASLFGGGPINISAVDFFAYGSAVSGSRSFTMSLSTSNNPVGGLSTTFASNVGANNAVFATSTFSGSYNLNDLFSFTGSFNYNPTAGDLLVDILSLDGGGGGAPYSMASTAPGVYSRAYAFSSTVSADGNSNYDGYGNRTQFVFGPQSASVPEPGTMALLGLGLLAAFGARRKTVRT